MTSKQESGLALMNIHYGRQIDIGATIDIFARKHPRRLLISDILSELTVEHKSKAFDETCNMLYNYFIVHQVFNFITVHLFRKRDLPSHLRNAGYVLR